MLSQLGTRAQIWPDISCDSLWGDGKDVQDTY